MEANNQKNNELDKETIKERNRLIERGVVFVFGVIFIFILVFLFGAEPCSASIFGVNFRLPTCEEERVLDTSSIAGTWTVSAGEGNSTLDIIITIVDDCEVGNVCGTINLPSIPCQASIYIRNIEGSHYDYDAIDHQGTCGPAGTEYLELQGDGSLAYTYNGLSRILRRK